MSTVDRVTAAKLAAGEFPEDPYTEIVAYENAWGGAAYKLLQPGAFAVPSNFIRYPRRVWRAGESLESFNIMADLFEADMKGRK